VERLNGLNAIKMKIALLLKIIAGIAQELIFTLKIWQKKKELYAITVKVSV